MARSDLSMVVQLGLGFFAIFSAFNSQGFVEISVLRDVEKEEHPMGIDKNSGYYSLAIIYFTFTFSNFIVPPVLKAFGVKWSLVIGASFYPVFTASFLFLNAPLLYITSALLGFGAAVLWTANGAYLVQASKNETMARNSGVMWAMMQGSLVCGSVFLYLFLHCSRDLVSTYRIIYLVFTIVSFIGVAILAGLPNPEEETSIPTESNDGRVLVDDVPTEQSAPTEIYEELPEVRSFFGEFKHTFAMMKQPQMMKMAVCFFYTGLELTFYTGVYSACLAASKKLNEGSSLIIAWNALFMGIGQIVGGLCFGIFARKMFVKLNRAEIVILAFSLHCLAFFITFLNLPANAPLEDTADIGYINPSYKLAIFTGLLLGLADAAWNTQIYSIIGMEWHEDSVSAFALFKFFQSLAACISFYYGSLLLLPYQLLILVISAFIAALCFLHAHIESATRIEDDHIA